MSLIGQWCGPCLRLFCGARYRVAKQAGTRVDLDKARRLIYFADGSGTSAIEPPEFWSRLPTTHGTYPMMTPEEILRYQETRLSLECVREALVCAEHNQA